MHFTLFVNQLKTTKTNTPSNSIDNFSKPYLITVTAIPEIKAICSVNNAL